MKRHALALGAAAALTVGSVCAPPQSAVAQEGDAPATSSEALGTGEILGITFGVLAAVGALGFFAVQQGLIQLPPNLAAVFPIPGAPAAPGKQPAQGGGSCAPQTFDALVQGWPGPFGTSVSFCNGDWAIAGMNGSDHIVYFRHVGNRWEKLRPVGTKQTGMTRGCYNGITLREQGAPEEFIRRAPICTPSEVGVFL